MSMSSSGASVLRLDLADKFVIGRDDVLRADIAFEREDFVEKAPGPQHRIAALVLVRSDADRAAFGGIERGDELRNKARTDRWHVAQNDHGTIRIRADIPDTALER